MTHTIELRRLPDWPERLAAYLDQHRMTPFEWGTHDCVLFAAGAVRAITGVQVLDCNWGDRAQAAVLLRRFGGLMAAVDSALPRLAAPALAQRGDVLMVQAPGAMGGMRRWLAVADWPRWWAPAPGGLSWGSAAQATHAWGVAHG